MNRWVSEKSVATFSVATRSKEESIECGGRHGMLSEGAYCIYLVFEMIGDVLSRE